MFKSSCCFACSGARRHDVFDCLDYGRPKSKHQSGQSAEERLAALAHALSARPDVEVKDKLGRTPLIVAAAAGDEPVVKYLLERQADPNATVRLTSSSTTTSDNPPRTPPTLPPLDPTRPHPCAFSRIHQDKRGWTALHCAAAYCKTHVCLLLLEQDNIDIEAVHDGGGTALAIAAHAGLEPVVRRLLELGADVRRKNFIGFSSLIMAIDGGHPAISKMLIEYGGRVDDPENFIGMTALHLATFVADDETLEQILRQLDMDSAGDPERKAEIVNMKTKFGLTSLYRAVANGHLSTVRLLLAHGADANTREGQKRSYSIAKSIGKVAVAQGPVDPNQMGFRPVLMSLFVDRGGPQDTMETLGEGGY